MYNALFNEKYQKWELVYMDDANDNTKVSSFISCIEVLKWIKP